MNAAGIASARGGRLAGRRIILTGAASGIGSATARLFVEEGATVALFDVKEIAGWEARPEGAHCIQADLLDRGGLQAAVRQAGEAMGGADGVVNCAGTGGRGELDDYRLEDWDRIFGVNLTAPFLVIQAALPLLRQARGASIVNVASGAGLVPNARGSPAYAASKGGLIALTKALAFDLAPAIRVNTVTPGVVDTAMTRRTVTASHADPNTSPFIQQYALKRIAEPVELARGILFLMSAEASFVTGTNLVVDGGRLFH